MSICQNEVLCEERQLMKWVRIFRVRIFLVGIFLGGGNFQGEFDGCDFSGWELSQKEFSWNLKKHLPMVASMIWKHCIRIFHDLIIFVYLTLSTTNKIQTISLVLAEILCVLFTLMSSFASNWKKNVPASWIFFSRTNEVKSYGLAQHLILRMLRDLISHSLTSNAVITDRRYHNA